MTQISEQRREQIVQTAKRIVDRHGPNRLTAEAITQEVGVSRPLLYHYFQNMRDLLDAVTGVYVRAFEDALARWEESWEDSPSPTERHAWAISLVQALRPELVDACPLLCDGQNGTDSAYDIFLGRCADTFAERALADDAPPAYGPCRGATQPRAMVRFAVFGLAGTLRGFPNLSDEDAALALGALWPTGDDGSDGIEGGQTADGREAPAEPAEGDAAPNSKRGILGWIFS